MHNQEQKNIRTKEQKGFNNAQFIMHNAQCTMHNAQCTMHNQEQKLKKIQLFNNF